MGELVRLQRYLAAAGVAARRKAEDLITAGRVTVNGDVVTISGELGCAKPDERVYHAAVGMLGLRPAEVAMVGDDLRNDVAGALEAGLGAAVWVAGFEEHLPPGARLARELAEVPRLLGLL